MRVSKKVTTEYEVDLVNKHLTPINISKAINDLVGAGVDMEKANFRTDERNSFVITVIKQTYYDDSTLNRMEK